MVVVVVVVVAVVVAVEVTVVVAVVVVAVGGIFKPLYFNNSDLKMPFSEVSALIQHRTELRRLSSEKSLS